MKKMTANMTAGLSLIKERIGEALFQKFFQVILTDRGSEFTQAEEMESPGCRIFFCDPMGSSQKPHAENRHGPLRFILPNSVNLREIELKAQEDLDLVMSHLNSYPLESLNGRTAYEYFEFMESSELLNRLCLKKIQPEELIMSPKLLKK